MRNRNQSLLDRGSGQQRLGSLRSAWGTMSISLIVSIEKVAIIIMEADFDKQLDNYAGATHGKPSRHDR